jgi:hypothetical protein
MITSPRRIRRLLRQHDRDLSDTAGDPMTVASGCGGEILQGQDRAFARRLKKLTGLSPDEAEMLVDCWERTKYPDTPRKRWKREDGARRYHAAMMAEWEEA